MMDTRGIARWLARLMTLLLAVRAGPLMVWRVGRGLTTEPSATAVALAQSGGTDGLELVR